MSGRVDRNVTSAWRSESGVSAIEFALLGPILILLALGLWDFGRTFAEASRLASAARAGAQSAILSTAHSADFAAIEEAARRDAGDVDGDISVDISRECACADGKPVLCSETCGIGGKPVIYTSIVVGKEIDLAWKWPLVGETVELSRKVRMRVQ